MTNPLLFPWCLFPVIGPLGMIAVLLLLIAVGSALCRRRQMALGLVIYAWQCVALNIVQCVHISITHMSCAPFEIADFAEFLYWANVPILLFSVPLTIVVLLLAIRRESVGFVAENKFLIVATLVGLFNVFLVQVFILVALFPRAFLPLIPGV